MKHISSLPAIAAILIASAVAAFSQGGPLAPPAGVHEPEMRSLQEIWDKIGDLEAQNTAMQNDVDILRGQSSAIRNQGLYFHYANGGSLPWQITTVDSAGSVGSSASLAFGPDGQPAISCRDIFYPLSRAFSSASSRMLENGVMLLDKAPDKIYDKGRRNGPVPYPPGFISGI